MSGVKYLIIDKNYIKYKINVVKNILSDNLIWDAFVNLNLQLNYERQSQQHENIETIKERKIVVILLLAVLNEYVTLSHALQWQ